MWSDARSALSHGLIIPPEPISRRNDAKVQRSATPECIKLYRSVLKCIVTYPNVSKRIEVYRNVSKCIKLYRNVLKCIIVYRRISLSEHIGVYPN